MCKLVLPLVFTVMIINELVACSVKTKHHVGKKKPFSGCLWADLLLWKSLVDDFEKSLLSVCCAHRGQKCFILSIIVCDSLTDYLSSKMTS